MIPGLTYITDFISLSEEIELLNNIDSNQWENNPKNQRYGYIDNLSQIKNMSEELYFMRNIKNTPEWLYSTCNKVAIHFDILPNLISINEYKPGQGFFKHIDYANVSEHSKIIFGPIIAILSLLSSCMMEFELEYNYKIKEKLWLESRSLVILSKEARYNWTHALPHKKTDLKDGILIPRTRRISLVFRTVESK